MKPLRSDVGKAIGTRMAEGRRVSFRVLEALTKSQLIALRRAMQHRGRDLPAGMFERLMKAAPFLVLLALGCADIRSATTNAAHELSQSQEDALQGCSWRRAVDSGFSPREGECWHVYAAEGARLSTFELASVCDAPKLPTCLAARSIDEVSAFYDRTDEPSEFIVRYARAAVLPDGTCESCE